MRQWLRASILGSNDGLVSNASLMVGVASAKVGNLAGIGLAGIAAGSMSMAVGEYVSVRSEGSTKEALQAAGASSLSFAIGGAIPLLGAFMPHKDVFVILFTIIGLFIAGVLSAKVADKPYVLTVFRIVMGGILGMIITAGIGALAHTAGM